MAEGTVEEPAKAAQTFTVALVNFEVRKEEKIIVAQYMLRDNEGNDVEPLPLVESSPEDWPTLATAIFKVAAEKSLTTYFKARYANRIKRFADMIVSA